MTERLVSPRRPLRRSHRLHHLPEFVTSSPYLWKIRIPSFSCAAFPDLNSREPMKTKYYEGELWKGELENILMPMLEKYDVVLVEDPEHLIQWQEAAQRGFSERPRF